MLLFDWLRRPGFLLAAAGWSWAGSSTCTLHHWVTFSLLRSTSRVMTCYESCSKSLQKATTKQPSSCHRAPIAPRAEAEYEEVKEEVRGGRWGTGRPAGIAASGRAGSTSSPPPPPQKLVASLAERTQPLFPLVRWEH